MSNRSIIQECLNHMNRNQFSCFQRQGVVFIACNVLPLVSVVAFSVADLLQSVVKIRNVICMVDEVIQLPRLRLGASG